MALGISSPGENEDGGCSMEQALLPKLHNAVGKKEKDDNVDAGVSVRRQGSPYGKIII